MATLSPKFALMAKHLARCVIVLAVASQEQFLIAETEEHLTPQTANNATIAILSLKHALTARHLALAYAIMLANGMTRRKQIFVATQLWIYQMEKNATLTLNRQVAVPYLFRIVGTAVVIPVPKKMAILVSQIPQPKKMYAYFIAETNSKNQVLPYFLKNVMTEQSAK